MLTLIVFIPLAAALALLIINKDNAETIRNISVGGAGLTFLISLALLSRFDSSVQSMQFTETLAWVPMFHINYQVGVDGISLWLVVLTAFISLIAVCFSLDRQVGFRNFMALLLALEAGILGVFVALDMILFYVFWELMLVPTYFLIGIWGEGNRVYATTKFVLYTLVGSLLMLLGIIWLSLIHFEATHQFSFDIQVLSHMKIDPADQVWLFLFFLSAFAIKIPIFPLHSWLPHAYISSPIPVLLLLTGAMSKAGAYGIIRFCLPLVPDAVDKFGLVIAFGAAAGIVYGAWIAVAQRDLKALVAYSSISHLGFIALGIFALNGEGIEGSVLQMVNHGIIASALFVIVGILEKRMNTRSLNDLRGLGKAMPLLYGMFMLITLAALGLPGLNGFVGEFLILMGVWTSLLLADLSAIYVLMAGLAIVFASIYMLHMFQGAMQGKNDKIPEGLTDINSREFGLLLPACILVVLIGLYPKPFIDRVTPSVESILTMEKTLNLHAGEDKGDHH
jgi:NADH-quinone oxidoreductase subunit M